MSDTARIEDALVHHLGTIDYPAQTGAERPTPNPTSAGLHSGIRP